MAMSRIDFRHYGVSYNRIQNGLSRGDGMDGSRQARCIDSLQEIAVCSSENSFNHRRIISKRGQKDYAGRGSLFTDFTARFNAASIGKADIHNNDVRGQFLSCMYTLGRCPYVADYADTWVSFEKGTQSFPNYIMVFDEKHAYC